MAQVLILDKNVRVVETCRELQCTILIHFKKELQGQEYEVGAKILVEVRAEDVSSEHKMWIYTPGQAERHLATQQKTPVAFYTTGGVHVHLQTQGRCHGENIDMHTNIELNNVGLRAVIHVTEDNLRLLQRPRDAMRLRRYFQWPRLHTALVAASEKACR